MNISDEAVAAAARILAAEMAQGDRDGYVEYEDLSAVSVDVRRVNLLSALAVAASHLMASAWGEGHVDGFWNGRLSHGDPEALTGIEHSQATNPYRTKGGGAP